MIVSHLNAGKETDSLMRPFFSTRTVRMVLDTNPAFSNSEIVAFLSMPKAALSIAMVEDAWACFALELHVEFRS